MTSDSHGQPAPPANDGPRPRSGAFESWRPGKGSRRGGLLPPGTLVGFAVAIVAVIVISLLSAHSRRERAETAQAMDHALDVSGRLQALMATLTEAETSQRGYLLTGDESYLDPYIKARAGIPGELDGLHDLLRANPDQQKSLSTIAAMVESTMVDLERTVELRRTRGLGAALVVVQSDRGKESMASLRAVVESLEAVERANVKVRSKALDDASEISKRLTWAGSALLLFLIGMAAYASSRDYGAQRLEAWLREGQTELGRRTAGEQPLKALAENVLSFLASYLGAQVGALYAVEADGRLIRVAGYALPDPHAHRGEVLQPGEGVLGQAARENRSVHLREVPTGYLPIASALGSTQPQSVRVAPLTADGVVNGAVELGFLRPSPDADAELLSRAAELVGLAMRASAYRAQLEGLLRETQHQAEALQTQQEELRVTNEELEEQGNALRDSQSRLERKQAELEESNVQLEEQTEVLTQQKDRLARAQTDLLAQAEEVGRASRYKSEFLANMSHELRTPLNSALILSKLLSSNKQGNLTAEQVKFAQSIYDAGNDLLALINDVLDLSKIEAGKMDLRAEPIRVQRLVDALDPLFRPLATQKGIALTLSVEPTAPETVITDDQRLVQVLKNLLSNAIKFTSRGEVSLRISAADDGRVAFAVRDTGIGIAEAQHQIIFDAFRQADGTTSRTYGGTGLGLSISRELTRLLGGELTLESAPGQGSTFTLVLPSAPPAPAAPSDAAAPPAPPAPQPALAARGAPAPALDDREGLTSSDRVLLVVEDDAAFAKILYDLGHELGFRCLLAPTADQGIELALRHPPTAVLLDLNLPDHSGLTVLDRLKREPATRHVPVQIVSVEDDTQTARSMGAAGHIIKPVRREELALALTALETKIKQGIRTVLVVEDNPVQRDSICHLLQSDQVRTVPVATAAEALEQLAATTHDCMVLDISLPDASGFELLDTMVAEERYAFPPVIVYTGRDLTADEEQRLHRYSRSIIIKGARSPERLLDEVTLFLHQVEANLPPDRQKMLGEARSREAHFEHRTVLLVEDDVRNIFALSSVLEPKGARLLIARNGQEALDLLAREPAVDLVLMDIMMPVMDGYQAMRQIRARPACSRVPIIALTAKAMPDDQARCVEAGANDYVAKPIDVEKLLSLMRVWMSK